VPGAPTMQLPESVQAIVNVLYGQNVALARGDDDQRRVLTKLIVEQVVFAHPGQGYGWKAASETRPPSKDGIARQVNGQLIGWDLFNGGTREPNQRPESIDLTGQWFIQVAGVDHLGIGPTPLPPVTAPPPSDDLATLRAELARLTAQVADHTGQIASLTVRMYQQEVKPVTIPKLKVTGRTTTAALTWKPHSHEIDLEVVPE
jgi:hypothetical protein